MASLADARLGLHELRTRLDLANLVAASTPVTDLGDSRYEAPCPFHDDRDPSFYVWRAEDGVWRAGCFGCDYGYGDVFDYLQRLEGLTFEEALGRARDFAEDAALLGDAVPVVSRAEADMSVEAAGLQRGKVVDDLVAAFLADKPIPGAEAQTLRTAFRLGVTRSGLLAVPNWRAGRCCSIKTRDPAAGWEWGAFKGSRESELYGWWRDDGKKPVVLCEGESDTWAVATWLPRVSAVGVQGARARPLAEWTTRLASREVYVLLDADESGDGGAGPWLSALPQARRAALPPGEDARGAGREGVIAALRRARG